MAVDSDPGAHSRRALPFATIDVASGRVIGSTRYGNIDGANRRLELGWTCAWN
jgi:hypothetical protein